jgi:hypothetical protein
LRDAFEAAVQIGKSNPEARRRLYDALKQPLALHNYSTLRLRALTELAEGLSLTEKLETIEAWGPHFPWEEKYLRFRLEAFKEFDDLRYARSRTDKQRYNRAKADYDRFKRQQGRNIEEATTVSEDSQE